METSIKGTLTSILARLGTIVNDQTIPIFNTIAVWNNQINRAKDASGYSFQYPAVFVETKKLSTERLGFGYKSYEFDIIIHVMDEQLDDQIGGLDQNLDVFDLRDDVITSLDMFRPLQTGNLVYISGEQDYNHDNVYHYELTFRGRMIDPIGNWEPIYSTMSLTASYNYTWQSQNFGATGSTFSV